MYPLVSSRLLIRPYRAGDIAQIADMLIENEHPCLQHPQAGTRAAELFNNISQSNPREALILGLFDQSDDKTLIGEFCARLQRDARNKWSLSYHIRKDWRRKKYMSEALDTILPAFVKNAGVRILVASTSPGNTGSQKLLRRAGFADAAALPQQMALRFEARI